MNELLERLTAIMAQVMRNFLTLDELLASAPEGVRSELAARISAARQQWEVVEQQMRDGALTEAYQSALNLSNMYDETYDWYQSEVATMAEDVRARVQEALDSIPEVVREGIDPLGIMETLEEWRQAMRSVVNDVGPPNPDKWKGLGILALLGVGTIGVIAVTRK